MLIMARRIGEEIYVDKGRIKIILVSERDGIIDVGVQAPRHIDVERKEVFVRKCVEQHAQAQMKQITEQK